MACSPTCPPTPTGSTTPTVDDVRDALHCLRHRGPDDTASRGRTAAPCSASTGCRSSTSRAAHQPLPYADGRYRIVFNGEIYNYLELREELAAAGATFATEGDTEAIVAGVPPVGRGRRPRLRGMFAFVIWDTPDRHGVRRPRPVRHQAAVHRAAGRRRARLQLGEEGAAGAAGRQQGGRRRRPGVPAALPDAAVRARAGHPAPRHPADRERHQLHGAPDGELQHRRATSTRRSRRGRSRAGAEQALYDRIAAVLRRLGGQAHARRRHGRRVPVRRHRLDRHRGAGQAVQPGPASRSPPASSARATPRSTSPPSPPPRSASSTSSARCHAPSEFAEAHRRWWSGTSTTRSPTRRSCRCTSSPARPASTSRWCSPARAPTSCSAATPSTASRCQPGAVRAACPAACAGRWARCRTRLPEGMRGKDLLRRGVDPAGGALLRQRPDLPRRRARRAAAHATTPTSRT